jgi:hypothetical protein
VRLVAFSHAASPRRRRPVHDAVPPWPPAVPAPAPAPVDRAAVERPPRRVRPVLGESVNVAVRTGTVTVKVPAPAGYVALSDRRRAAVGSILDTREGAITLRSRAAPAAGPSGHLPRRACSRCASPRAPAGSPSSSCAARSPAARAPPARGPRRARRSASPRGAVGPRQQGQLPHPRWQQRRHRARHRLVRRGPLRRHADARQQGQRVGV